MQDQFEKVYAQKLKEQSKVKTLTASQARLTAEKVEASVSQELVSVLESIDRVSKDGRFSMYVEAKRLSMYSVLALQDRGFSVEPRSNTQEFYISW